MATNASSYLSEVTKYYTPSPGEFDAAKAHRYSIEARLDGHLGLNRMFEIGSLRHGTGVWYYSDVDYLASLKGIRPDSSISMLNRVRDTLKGRFPSTPVVVRRPAVVCKFSDGDVEVVPGYITSDLGYSIADPSGGWITSHPEEHNKYVTSVNKKHSGGAKLLARQVKIWKYKRNVPISSCYLEMRAAKHLDGESSYLPLWDLYLSLKKMRDAQLASMNDPTGLGSRFGSCSSEAMRLDSMSKLDRAVVRAEKAKTFDKAGENAKAIEQLKLLFNK